MLYNYHHYLVPELFHHPKKEPVTIKQSHPTPPIPDPWQKADGYMDKQNVV